MPLTIRLVPHQLSDPGAFVARLGKSLSEIATPSAGVAPLSTSETVKTAVRDLLRYGGFKPAGRSKPASEYLVGAHAEGRWPAINALVDTCNIVSFHSGLPISIVD